MFEGPAPSSPRAWTGTLKHNHQDHLLEADSGNAQQRGHQEASRWSLDFKLFRDHFTGLCMCVCVHVRTCCWEEVLLLVLYYTITGWMDLVPPFMEDDVTDQSGGPTSQSPG